MQRGRNRLDFSLIFGLIPYLGLSDALSERLIQKVKSPTVGFAFCESPIKALGPLIV